MPGFIPKKFPGKIAEPMVPFYAAGLIVLYAINAGANAMMASDEFKNDPRNPNQAASGTPKSAH
ncbi:atp18 subunit J of the mitochondrial F1F0 ATP synthase [Exophiala dermatitidis]|uniref:F-type H+-transporting ATPase subunit J n=2 Tax=Exophiala dermatitidis TaxID=5970 RepID=H6BQG8_EXODN|nr:F-type H+-transporting ATPase subunit J [Exophiala dermatitidis NIH/UT8656]KAJ4574489.1 atp18 subunit J of the mitochondrial F1F0 ATP synthase [Exophiala dermatitidis]EHY54561.1 F-type H+-transporting ATPase subunit J [Exophiala dermatitidis NIH/UT8656]KAJ4582250.1 atp18 subunit J of the mitochondrial F1F0 ATP synthase [Exophiala dermatitidis]KAJ4598171.1 atp18 subunit J of the mitochondrial F1F0 ATP synthase [Exophiala dermatitidis]KAJ4612073.1 atp18 subunit J of the mitochondrial F1F0 ATP